MKKNNVVLIVILSTVLILSFVLLNKGTGVSKNFQQNTPLPQTTIIPNDEPKTTSGYKLFRSNDVMDFSVQIPENYTVKEGLTYVEFMLNNDYISMGRNGAGWINSLDEYLLYRDEKNDSSEVDEIKELNINGYSAVVRDEIRGGVNARLYYIDVEEWVYVFSTKSESLYSDLDQIAQSFQYTP